MAMLQAVNRSVGPTYVGPNTPPSPLDSETWCDTSAVPYVLKVWSDFSGSWGELAQYPESGIIGSGVSPATTKYRPQRNVWVVVQCESTDGIPTGYPAGTNWFDPCNGNAKTYDGTDWVDFTFGELSGGNAGYSGTSGNIEILSFSSETLSDSGVSFPNDHTNGHSFNSADKGYTVGGTASTSGSAYVFSTDTVSNLGALLSAAHAAGDGFESEVNGYSHGGVTSNVGGPLQTYMFRIPFTTETATNFGTDPNSFELMRGFNSADSGYMLNGTNGSMTGPYNIVSKIPFSTETPSNLGAILSQAKSAGACAESLTHGFMLAGYLAGGPPVNTVEKLDFSSDTATAPSALPYSTYRCSANNSLDSAYVYGGISYTTTIGKLLFSGDVTSTLAVALSSPAVEGECFEWL